MDLPTIEWMEETLRQHKGRCWWLATTERFAAVWHRHVWLHGANYAAVMVILMNLKAGQMGFWLMKQ